MSLLEVSSISAGYGPIRVLHGLDLQVGDGEVVALLGRNGAGKSTTLKTIMGLVRATAGKVVYGGRDVTALPPHRRARLGLGYVPEDRRIFPELTVCENLEIARKRGANGDGWTVERVFTLMPFLKEIQRRRGGLLSGGEQQMLTIARTMMGKPQLLLLDEPTEGLAPLFVQQIAALVGELKRGGTSVLLAEQNLAFIKGVANRVYVLETGEMRLAGALAEVVANPDVHALLAL
jgi:branched-chain amino acid transport system ATP-binding protein